MRILASWIRTGVDRLSRENGAFTLPLEARRHGLAQSPHAHPPGPRQPERLALLRRHLRDQADMGRRDLPRLVGGRRPGQDRQGGVHADQLLRRAEAQPQPLGAVVREAHEAEVEIGLPVPGTAERLSESSLDRDRCAGGDSPCGRQGAGPEGPVVLAGHPGGYTLSCRSVRTEVHGRFQGPARYRFGHGTRHSQLSVRSAWLRLWQVDARYTKVKRKSSGIVHLAN